MNPKTEESPVLNTSSPFPPNSSGKPFTCDFEHLFIQSAAPAVIVDAGLRVAAANLRFAAMLDTPLEQLQAQNSWLDKFSEADRDRLITFCADCCRPPAEDARGCEITIDTKSAKPLRYLVTCTTVKDGAMMMLSFADISSWCDAVTILRSEQEKLQREHATLTTTFKLVERAKCEWERSMDRIDDLVVLIDGQGAIKRCNRAFADFTGKPYAELVGQNLAEFFDDFTIAPEKQNARGVEIYHEESDRWFLFNVYDGQKQFAETVVVCHEFSEKKRLSLALEESNRQLEASRNELEKAFHDLEATQSQMLQQEKMASLGQLAAGVAHEINNPMGFISSNLASLDRYAERIIDFLDEERGFWGGAGFSETQLALLRQRRKELKIDFILEDIRSLVAESLDGAERVKKIVQDLKSFSRKDENEEKVADIGQCLDTTINVIWNELKYKAGIEKEYGDLPPLLCHPQALNQVFMNLLMNAAQAIDGQGTIRIRTWHQQQQIFVEIQDDGCGIPAENLGRLFEPFFTTKEVGQGTGLGLSVSYEIVKRHGGEIRVASTPGAGTTFTVILPVVREEGT